MKKTIITLIVGVLIGTISSVLASTYLANQIAYTPKDKTWKVDSVGAAIDSLYLSKAGNNYSTEETVVGTWIDGKPIYQRCFEILSDLLVSVNDNNYHSVDGFTNNYSEMVAPIIDKLVHIDVLNNGSQLMEANTFFRINKSDGTLHSVDSPYFHWLGFNLSAGSVIVIQYTKTT